MRLRALLVLLVTACSNGGGASVTLAIPASTQQSLAGFDAGGRAVLSLAVVCDDGRGGTYEQELSTRVESAGFFVPACGRATLNLTINAEYGDQEPVVAFEASNTALLESGVNADVEFTGVAYGELILDPLGQPITSCTYEDAGGLYGLQNVSMDGSVVALRVPAADYDIYCFDAFSPLPNYQPTRVGAGQRAGPDLTLRPDNSTPPPPPELSNLSFFGITETSALVTWAFRTYSIATITFTLEVALDATFSQQARAPIVTAQGNQTLEDLTPGTRYYVRVTGTDAWGTSNTLVGQLDTLTPPGSPYLSEIRVNGALLTPFSPTMFGYSYSAQSSDATLTFQATTLDPTSFVRVEADGESLGSTTSVQPIPFGNTQVDIFVRNADGSATQSYAIAVFRPPT